MNFNNRLALQINRLIRGRLDNPGGPSPRVVPALSASHPNHHFDVRAA